MDSNTYQAGIEHLEQPLPQGIHVVIFAAICRENPSRQSKQIGGVVNEHDLQFLKQGWHFPPTRVDPGWHSRQIELLVDEH